MILWNISGPNKSSMLGKMTRYINNMPESECLSWETLKKLNLQTLAETLPRKLSVQQSYMVQRNDPKHQPTLVAMIRDGLRDRKGIWLRKNDYPYHTPSDVEHLVLWFTDPVMSLQEAQSWVADYLGLLETQIVVCCNAPCLKTVPEINHYHVFIRHVPAISDVIQR